MGVTFYKKLFAVAAAYDIVLGFAFFFFYHPIYSAFGITLPENSVYIHISSAFVFVQGLSYWFVYLNLRRNIDIVKIGLVYKLIYAAVALFYWTIGQLPHAMFGLFGILDLVFAGLFVLYLRDYDSLIAESA